METLFRDVALSNDVKRMSHKLIGSTKDRDVERKAERNERKVRLRPNDPTVGTRIKISLPRPKDFINFSSYLPPRVASE
jgi:hypothetical protein